MELNTLKDLYIHELKDLYSAEKQIIRALPKMVKAASNEQLAAGFKEHLEQTRNMQLVWRRFSPVTIRRLAAPNAKAWKGCCRKARR